jgi:hypothetical protein
MKFLIIAVDHDTQIVPLRDEAAESVAKKARVEAIVKEAIAKFDIDLICEESDPRYLTIAQKLAYENNPRIPWRNIFMTSQERLEAGIWKALLYRPYHLNSLDEWNAVRIDHRIPEDDIREEFFNGQTIRAANECGADRILVVCGDMHVEPLKTKLEAGGHEAETSHDLVPEKKWQ